MNVQEGLRRQILVAGVLIVVAGLFAGSATLHAKLDGLLDWSEALIAQQSRLGMIVFVLIAMLSALLAFFSSAVFAPIAVYAWGRGITFLLLWTGWILGGMLSFCIGRYLGRRVAGMLVGDARIAGWQAQVSRRTRFIHILFFQAVVPSEIPGYVLGILRYRFTLYLAALAITELPYAFGVIFLGESFLKGEGKVIILLGAGVIIVGTLLRRYAWQWMPPG